MHSPPTRNPLKEKGKAYVNETISMSDTKKLPDVAQPGDANWEVIREPQMRTTNQLTVTAVADQPGTWEVTRSGESEPAAIIVPLRYDEESRKLVGDDTYATTAADMINEQDVPGPHHYELCRLARDGKLAEFTLLAAAHATKHDLEWVAEYLVTVEVARYVFETRGTLGFRESCYERSVLDGLAELTEYMELLLGQETCIRVLSECVDERKELAARAQRRLASRSAVERANAAGIVLAVHADWMCDACGQAPIRGTRYRCLQCAHRGSVTATVDDEKDDASTDFDLCASCYADSTVLQGHDVAHTFEAVEFPETENDSKPETHLDADGAGDIPTAIADGETEIEIEEEADLVPEDEDEPEKSNLALARATAALERLRSRT